MIAEVRVPKLGMTQEDIVVVELHKSDGDAVEKDELVVTIETKKVTYEVLAPSSGLIFYLRQVKDKVVIGEVLAVVAEGREEFEEYRSSIVGAPEAEMERVPVEEEPVSLPPVDLSGRRIGKRIPFLGIRRTIAKNLVSSLQTGAQLTIVSETDMTELDRFRRQFNQNHQEANITFVDIIVKIVAAGLKEFPIVNATVVRDEIVCFEEYNIGVATALDDGLVVPVVRDVDQKTLIEVSLEIKELARKARNNELEPSHFQGGTFTVSSGGKVDTDIITPIINPPEVAILAFGKIRPKPVVYEGQIAIRTMTNLCLTHDHRVVDGVPASLFLGRVKEIIEQNELFENILQ